MLASIDPTRRGAHDSLAGVATSPRTLAGGASSGVAMVASARPRGRSRPRDGSVGRAGSARATRSSSIALAVTALFALVAPSDGGRALKGSALDAFEVDARSAAGAADSDAASAPASDASAASDGACTLVGYGVGERVRDGWYTMRDGEVRAYPPLLGIACADECFARASDSDVAYEGAERSVRDARACEDLCVADEACARWTFDAGEESCALFSLSRDGGLPAVSPIPGADTFDTPEVVSGDANCRRAFLAAEELAGRDACLLYTSPSPRDATLSRMPSSA